MTRQKWCIVQQITEEIKECRKIKKYCEDIEIRSYSIVENIKEIDKENILLNYRFNISWINNI